MRAEWRGEPGRKLLPTQRKVQTVQLLGPGLDSVKLFAVLLIVPGLN